MITGDKPDSPLLNSKKRGVFPEQSLDLSFIHSHTQTTKRNDNECLTRHGAIVVLKVLLNDSEQKHKCFREL